MRTLALEACDALVRDFVKSLGTDETIVLTEKGEPRYVLGGVEDFEWEVFVGSRNHDLMDYLEQARTRGRTEETISIAEARDRLGVQRTAEANASDVTAGG